MLQKGSIMDNEIRKIQLKCIEILDLVDDPLTPSST